MTATFGKLQSRTLELQDGLNIIQAPNETGKSTWCAFLLSMLYGINSRERDKAGFIADKNRYAPWSGYTMSGHMECQTNGDSISISRTTRRQTSPLGEFQAVYTGTGNAVPELNAQNCGELLLGVSREVFERSAFIRQAGLPINQDAGLERRIAALIASGEEETSYSEAADALKKQLNRRRHNKTGQIPTLEAELSELQAQISASEQLERQAISARLQIETFSARVAALEDELAQHDLWEAVQQQNMLDDATASAEQAEAHAAALRQRIHDANIPENETIARLRGALVNLETTRKAVEKARGERDDAAKALLKAESAVSESPFAGQTAESAWKFAASFSDSKPWPLSELLPSIFMGLVVVFLMISDIGSIVYGIPAAIGALIIPFYKNRKWKKETAAALKKHGVSSTAELREQAAAYGELLKKRDDAQAELDKRSAAADTLYNTLFSNEQAILLEIRRFAPTAFDFSTADALLRECAQQRKQLAGAETVAKEARIRCDLLQQQIPPRTAADPVPVHPLRSREQVNADLNASRAELSAAHSTADRLTGQLHALGDPVVLRSAAAELQDKLDTLNQEYSAIRLAMDALDTANTTLQNRFSPALGQRAAEIFSVLTGGRYNGVVLDRAFHLSAEPKGSGIYRDAQLLSAGASDQLYLAVRLAICELVLPPEHSAPIILDDALANFDDARCAAALRWLKSAAKERQILLFTCHSREGEFFAEDHEVSVQRLTDAAEKV